MQLPAPKAGDLEPFQKIATFARITVPLSDQRNRIPIDAILTCENVVMSDINTRNTLLHLSIIFKYLQIKYHFCCTRKVTCHGKIHQHYSLAQDKPWFSMGFPKDHWFSHGFPMVFPWFSRLEHRSGILQELRDAELRQALGHAAQQLRGLFSWGCGRRSPRWNGHCLLENMGKHREI